MARSSPSHSYKRPNQSLASIQRKKKKSHTISAIILFPKQLIYISSPATVLKKKIDK